LLGLFNIDTVSRFVVFNIGDFFTVSFTGECHVGVLALMNFDDLVGFSFAIGCHDGSTSQQGIKIGIFVPQLFEESAISVNLGAWIDPKIQSFLDVTESGFITSKHVQACLYRHCFFIEVNFPLQLVQPVPQDEFDLTVQNLHLHVLVQFVHFFIELLR
jgi:hypothetical protein